MTTNPTPKGWRDVSRWTPERRVEYVRSRLAAWEAMRARRGWITAAEAVDRANALLPRGKWAEAEHHTIALGAHAKRLRTKARVSLTVCHKLTLPGLGTGVCGDQTFSGPRYEVCLIALRSWLQDRREVAR